MACQHLLKGLLKMFKIKPQSLIKQELYVATYRPFAWEIYPWLYPWELTKALACKNPE